MNTALRLLTLALLASGTVGLANCKKDKELDPDKRSQREIWLTSSGWKLQRFVQTETTPTGVVSTIDFPPSYFPACQQDNLIHFNADRTLTTDEGPLQCQPPMPPTTWEFAANETEIAYGSQTRHAKIVDLTATTLVLASADTLLVTGVSASVTQTYAAH
jgi:hypothetical protein